MERKIATLLERSRKIDPGDSECMRNPRKKLRGIAPKSAVSALGFKLDPTPQALHLHSRIYPDSEGLATMKVNYFSHDQSLLAEHKAEKQETSQGEDFSLVLGGPLYRLMLRSGLIQRPLGHLVRRIAVISGTAWLPLMVLTIIGGRFAGGVRVPFLYDISAHARLLFALPLMILAELVVFLRMCAIPAQFVERQIIRNEVLAAFQAVIASALRLRNSLAAEIGLLMVVVAFGPYLRSAILVLQADTWYASVSSSIRSYTPAGYWWKFVSIPIFQFILLRWYYRIFVWWRFLFQVSRLNLNLVPLHPDRCAGLGFLGNIVLAFDPLLIAQSGLISGAIANRILYDRMKLLDFKVELLSTAAILLVMVLGPLCVFAPKLNRARKAGLRTYGKLASDYVVGFARKWSQGSQPAGEPLLGSSDIQSLADLAHSFAVVKGMRVVPFGKDTIMQFLLVIASPLVPLVFTMFSVEDVLKQFLKLVL